MAVVARSYEQINLRARPYPSEVLPVHGTGLALFCAAFHGWNDVVHMARAEMRIDCVDIDKDRLWEMANVYPQSIAYHVDDAWEFAERAAANGRQWDVVSVDPFFGDAAEKAWETLYLWTSVAKNLVTLTVKADTVLNTPAGWTASHFPRNDRAAWLVLQRA